MLLSMKSVTITQKGQISIPKEMRELKGFEEGCKVALLAYKDRIELKPLDEINECFIMSEKVLAKDWLSKEDEEAWKDL
jgi:AbrB family looped-hinge helix DNA binding protein